MGRLIVIVLALAVSAVDAEPLRVSVEHADLHMKPDALSPVISALKFQEEVRVLNEVSVRPETEVPNRKGISYEVIPTWVKVECGMDQGYVPVLALAKESAIRTSLSDACALGAETRSAKHGFSESEDDVALVSMKGAAGKGRMGKASARDVALLEVRSSHAALTQVKSFLFEGSLEGEPFQPAGIGTGKGWLAKIDQAGSLTDKQIAKYFKLKKMAGDSTNEEVRLAFKAMDAMLMQSCNWIDPVREHLIGKLVAARVLAEYKPVDARDSRCEYVDRIGQALVSASNYPMSLDGYRFIVVESKYVNAFALPGGFVFVMTGLLDFAKDEDELAAVLAHEIAHVELQHGVKHVGFASILNLFAASRDYALKEDFAADKSLESALDLVFRAMIKVMNDGYGEEVESQADWRGMQLASRLGYDVTATHEILLRMREKTGSCGGSGYPKTRLEDIERYCAGMKRGRADSHGRESRKSRFAAAVRP